MNRGLIDAAPDLLEACKKWQSVFDELFGHCLSNGVFNAWGQPLDCTKMNEASEASNAAIAKAEGKP